jgi:pimeloyl-ACP methyl ester carboxylesterase
VTQATPDDPFASPVEVPVAGGRLHVATTGPVDDRPLALCVHGITSSSRAWTLVAAHLDGAGVAVAAPDLRGRAASNGLPGPFGMAAHAADLVAVLDHLGVDRAVVAGHSMGAYVVARLAADHPDRVAGVVLVDGGLPLPRPAGLDGDVQAALDAILGPAIARLRQTFASEDEYVGFWRAHPAFAEPGAWGPAVEAYARYDLAGEPPALRSRVSEEAVRVDGAELLVDEAGQVAALRSLAGPVVLLRAPAGLLGSPPPFVPADLADAAAADVPALTVATVEGTNHYTLTLAEPGASAVADAIRGQLGA